MLIGHERQLKNIGKISSSGAIPHAFLFYGPENIGKSTISKLFFYLCAKKDSSEKDFFSKERLAVNFREENVTDFFVASADKNKKEIGIDQIRALKKFVGLSPFELNKKFVLVKNAERTTKEGINSILKTLEEPSPETVIVLTSSRPSSLPATVRSRSINIPFYPISNKSLQAGLGKINKKISEEELRWIAGRPGLAIRFLQNPEDEEIKKRRESFFSFEQTLKNKNVIDKISLAEKVAGEDWTTETLSSWLIAARESLVKSFNEESLRQTKSIFRAREIIKNTNSNTRLQLERALLNY